ncbi:hypothetical protein VTJ83DRAFT_2706 [Remersonia thermophila]|uniref:Rhodopsin domain-containing protein n=1 Tax=Remersonia thermophila TaxID=72144 RepID=A0ABR4DJQ1_9PEZI
MSAPDMPPLPSNPAENDGPRILGATLTVTTIAVLTSIARIYVRTNMVRSFGLDDYFMVFATLLVIVEQGIVIGSVHHGAGRHMGDLAPEDIGMGMKLNFISQPLYLFGICFVKLSAGAMLLRIASVGFYRRLIIGVMVFMSVYTVACFFTLVLQCTDIRVMWDMTVQATCWAPQTLQALSYTNVALNIFTDLLFAIFIPVPMLWNLNVNTRTRISIMVTLGLGIFACAAAFIKMGYLFNYGINGDWLWDSRDLTIWAVTEVCVAMVGANLPSLRPLFKSFLGTTFGYGSATGKKNTTGYQRQHDTTPRRNKSQLDETSSERAFNPACLYEMNAQSKQSKMSTVVFSDRTGLSSDDTVNASRGPAAAHNGITMTTSTNIEYSS